jgi:hypothetical protein
MNRGKKLVNMVVPDINTTPIEEISEMDNVQLLESLNNINDNDLENWAVDENGKEVDLTPIVTSNNFNNFDNYEIIMTDNSY